MKVIQIIGHTGSGKHKLGYKLAEFLGYSLISSPAVDQHHDKTLDSFNCIEAFLYDRVVDGIILIGSSNLTYALYMRGDLEQLDDTELSAKVDILITLLPSKTFIDRNISERGRDTKDYEYDISNPDNDVKILEAAQYTTCQHSHILTEVDYVSPKTLKYQETSIFKIIKQQLDDINPYYSL